MASQKLVRCEIRRRGASVAGSPRFIPLEIFGLWEYLMSSKHDFEVVNPRASLWLDMGLRPPPTGSTTGDRGVGVRPLGRDEISSRACRYFRTDESERSPIFLSHYLAGATSPRPTSVSVGASAAKIVHLVSD